MTLEEAIKDRIKSEVWNALESIAMKHSDELHKEAMEEAVEWFIIKFYDDIKE